MTLFGSPLCLAARGIARQCWNQARTSTHAVLRICLLFGALLTIHAPAAIAEQPGPETAPAKYTIAITPQFEQRKLHTVWQPIVDELERRTGLHFSLVSMLTIQEFDKALSRGHFDFVYTNPYNIVLLHDVQPYIPLVADKEPIRGIVAVRKDGEIKTLADLDGKTVAFPAPNSLGASLMVRADLEQMHHVRVTPLYVKTHSSVYLHVLTGLAVAGGGVEKTLKEQSDSVKSQLQVLYVTRACPSLPFAAHPRLSSSVREKVRAALLALNDTQEGKELLSKVPVKEFIPVSYEDYAIMSTWGLEKYSQNVSQ